MIWIHESQYYKPWKEIDGIKYEKVDGVCYENSYGKHYLFKAVKQIL